MRFFLVVAILSVFFLSACQSVTPMKMGTQAAYEGLNPAIIIAVPIFLIPDPSNPSASIDPSILISHKITAKIEEKIMESFATQPNINGYSFTAVAKALGGNKSSILLDMNANFRSVIERLSSRDPRKRVLITPNCLARHNFVEFYTFCLSNEALWIQDLNDLSAHVLNADTALIVTINDLGSKQINGRYQIKGSFSVLLLDTNNGKLIWGNYSSQTLTNPAGQFVFPEWNKLIDLVFTPSFWSEFPGRIIYNSNKKISKDSI